MAIWRKDFHAAEAHESLWLHSLDLTRRREADNEQAKGDVWKTRHAEVRPSTLP